MCSFDCGKALLCQNNVSVCLQMEVSTLGFGNQDAAVLGALEQKSISFLSLCRGVAISPNFLFLQQIALAKCLHQQDTFFMQEVRTPPPHFSLSSCNCSHKKGNTRRTHNSLALKH